MKRNRLVQLLGLLSSGIGGLSICGYIAGNPKLYTWAGDNGMALNGAILFTLQGIIFYIVGYINIKENR